MKRLPFGLLAGGLVTTIVILMIAAGWLAASIVNRELAGSSTAHPWLTATFQPESTLVVSPTSGIEMPAFSLSATPTSIFIVPTNPALPPTHPILGPNPQPCAACHQNVHGGGG